MKEYTINEWCEIFGIKIIDNDGFPRQDLNNGLVSLEKFLNGSVVCTITITNVDRYKILNKLW